MDRRPRRRNGRAALDIGTAVEARAPLVHERRARRRQQGTPEPHARAVSRATAHELIDAVRDALYASKIISYAQGIVQLGAAAQLYNWNLNFGDIATIWRGGCIIRARFLNRITEAYERIPASRT